MTKEQIERNEAWAAALESGRFKQNSGGLRCENAFCCLGVACHVFRSRTGSGQWIEDGVDFGFHVPGGISASDVAPRVVADWFGWDQRDVYLDDGATSLPASVWNDSRRADFPKIAGLVRRMIKETVKSGTEESGVEK